MQRKIEVTTGLSIGAKARNELKRKKTIVQYFRRLLPFSPLVSSPHAEVGAVVVGGKRARGGPQRGPEEGKGRRAQVGAQQRVLDLRLVREWRGVWEGNKE